MDRTIVYPGAIPLDTDILSIQRYGMIAFGATLSAVFGTATVVDGLGVTPGTGLTVQVAAGSIFSAAPVDPNAFGSLPSDTADTIIKCGINTQPVNSTAMQAPTTLGQATNFLLEAQFQESDGGATVLSFYNAANPALPYTGPANGGTASNTMRLQRATLQLKPGNPSAAGSQVTPGVDTGWTPLAIITVNYGATSLTAANIVAHPAAPYILTKLPQVRRRLTANLNLYVATNGNDSNSGLAPWNAFATMQAAWAYIISTLDLASQYSVNVNVAAGTYNVGLTGGGSIIGLGAVNGVTFVGAGLTQTFVTTVNAHAIYAVNGANFSVQGMSLAATGNIGGTPVAALCAVNSSQIGASLLNFGTSALHMWATQSSTISIFGNYFINGSASNAHLQASANSSVLCTNCGVTINGTVSFANFASSSTGYIQTVNGSYVINGSVTGTRYSASLNGIINTNNGSATFFPGNAAGAVSSGGQYV